MWFGTVVVYVFEIMLDKFFGLLRITLTSESYLVCTDTWFFRPAHQCECRAEVVNSAKNATRAWVCGGRMFFISLAVW